MPVGSVFVGADVAVDGLGGSVVVEGAAWVEAAVAEAVAEDMAMLVLLGSAGGPGTLDEAQPASADAAISARPSARAVTTLRCRGRSRR
jgi:hypothetical protein